MIALVESLKVVAYAAALIGLLVLGFATTVVLVLVLS